MWFADDGSVGGKSLKIKEYWDTLKNIGPKYGYFPKASKTVIIVKRPEDLEEVNRIFHGEGIKITVAGERHIWSRTRIRRVQNRIRAGKGKQVD